MSKQGGLSDMPIAAIAFHKNFNLLAEVRHDFRPLMCLFIRVLDGVSVIYLKDITEAYPLSLLCMEINSNRLTWNRTRDDRLEGGSYIRLTMSP